MFPETVVHSRRLVLRAFDTSDIPDTRASCSDSLTQRWLPLPQPYTLDDATAWCTTSARAMRDSGDGIQFAITDATRTLAHWLLTNQHFQRMELRAAAENTVSRAVALKAGFHREGTLRNAGFVRGARVDLVLFSLLPGDLGSSTDPTKHR
ncbi:GNAT family N-acetyltransferase [Streptomyces sp. NPDC058231]|uniref:GNAT family N-acetyltransferase n=1 Tax=Streptomyces sp. NPDC058231 TaxID=3346392 RepID=UPI0036E699B3